MNLERLSLVSRLLSRRIGLIDPEVAVQIRILSLRKLDALGEALLDFSQPSDLIDWLHSNT